MAQTDHSKFQSGPIDLIKQRPLMMLISLLFLVPSLYFMIAMSMTTENHAPLRLGIDFTGGTILEYGFQKPIAQTDIPAIRAIFDEKGYTGSVIQIQQPSVELSRTAAEETAATAPVEAPVEAPVDATEGAQDSVVTDPASSDAALSSEPPAQGADVVSIVSIRSKQLKGNDGAEIQQALQNQFGPLTLLQKNSIGPTLATELLKNGVLALVLAYLLIIGYLTFRFQFDYAVCAIVALIHDTVVVFGAFAMMGYLFNTEIDSLFVTGILTVVGFSVHDTIVVFDRLRENSKVLYTQKLPFTTIANLSVNQTLARSINTSLTALLTLFALYFLGGETTRDFVLCMILGIAFGTYSSIFVASALLAWWRERQAKRPKTATTTTTAPA